MIEVYKKTELEKLMRAHGLRFSKSLGQNFLTDRNIAEKIVRAAALSQDDHVVEIGAGAGALTVLLAREAGRVTAVEIDRRLLPALRQTTEDLSNVTLACADFLDFDLSGAAPYKIVGNLPYYITTPILAKLFERRAARNADKDASLAETPPPALAVLMMQKEVAERLLSAPSKKTYGAISVLIQHYTEPELLFEVGCEVFQPKPSVDSAVIRLKPRDLSAYDGEIVSRMFRLVRAGFDMRRKTLRNSLSRTGYSPDALAAAFEASSIDPVRRAETLSPREFYNLAAALPEL